MNTEIRLRFAPSPTGPLHIGGVRTALFNYLFAKKNNGVFILRIEDTDQNRFVKGAEDYIVESLKWLGMDFDESPEKGGPFAPYRQSERKNIYEKYAQFLIDNDKAYYAFDSQTELDEIRTKYELEKKAFQYDCFTRKCMKNSLTLSKSETLTLIKAGHPYVIRFKMPENTMVSFNDLIRGDMEVNTNTLDDKVLYKSDGMPTYHLANIVDDYEMKISHVIRGEEWLPSLPLHVLLYKAFGWNTPLFAHLPLILKPDGKGKLSKRDGDKMGFPVFPINWKNSENDVFPGYREEGYLPEAVVNMLVLLGWNPGTEQEIFSMNELSEIFSLERIGKSGSKFDPEKTRWFNQQYLKNQDNLIIANAINKLLTQSNIEIDNNILIKFVDLFKERAYFYNDIVNEIISIINAPSNYDEATVRKKWKENSFAILNSLLPIISNIDSFTNTNIENAIKTFIDNKSLSFGDIMPILRLVLTGKGQGPDLFKLIEIIGKEESINRISIGLKNIK